MITVLLLAKTMTCFFLMMEISYSSFFWKKIKLALFFNPLKKKSNNNNYGKCSTIMKITSEYPSCNNLSKISTDLFFHELTLCTSSNISWNIKLFTKRSQYILTEELFSAKMKMYWNVAIRRPQKATLKMSKYKMFQASISWKKK